jgi:predicted nucleic acid-binding protein
MTFWDSSALVPLCCEEADSPRREAYLATDPQVIVWYGTWAELESALSRRTREGSLPPDEAAIAREKIGVLAQCWMEVEATAEVRDRAIRLLRVHDLRSGEAFQLAAALIVFQERPAQHVFLTADLRLAEAARREGFRVE